MDYDFIVVGAGMAGASIAYELSRTARVVIVEAEARPGVHATGRSAALFAPTYGGREIRAVTRASRAFFDNPPSGFSEVPLLRDRGCLYIANADQRERLTRMAESISASGGRVSTVSKAEAMRRIPLLRDAYLSEAILDPDAMDLDVDALHQGFLRGLRAAGAEILTDARLTRASRKDGVWSLTVGEHNLQAPTVINAAGAWGDEVAKICGADPVGLQALRRTAMLVDPPAGMDISAWPAVIDVDEEFYFKPDAGKLLLSPADEVLDVPRDVQPEEMDIALGVDRVQAALNIEVRRVSHSWAGLRTFAPDRTPVVGFDPIVEGLFWCAGQGGYGIQTAPALGRTAAALALGKTVPTDVATEGLAAADLSPGRFAPPRAARRL
jgi:D-arginine dehydrogenase